MRFTSVFRFELNQARRARAVTVFAGGFTLGTIVLALVGMSAGGTLTVQGFARTSMSLMQLVLWVVPLMGLLLGATAGSECLELEFQASLPVSRSQWVVARWMAWVVVLGAAMTIGLGAAGIILGVMAGAGDWWRYLRLVGVSNLLLAASVAIGILIGVVAGSRVRALACGMVAWIVLVIGIDLVAIGALAILPAGSGSWGLTAILMADPVDAARTLSISLLQADVVSGPTGAALRKVLGAWGSWALMIALLGWITAPVYLAGRRFTRLDL